MYVCAMVYACVLSHLRDQQMAFNLLDLELRVIVSYPKWVLRTSLSRRAARTLNC